jgi:hypothetical protein
MADPEAGQATIDLDWTEGDTTVRWTYDRQRVAISFEEPPVSVVAWHDPPCVIVVEPFGEPTGRWDGRKRNAIVYNADGSERVRLIPPERFAGSFHPVGFYAVYRDRSGLVAVVTIPGADFWGRPNLDTGELTNVSEWR